MAAFRCILIVYLDKYQRLSRHRESCKVASKIASAEAKTITRLKRVMHLKYMLKCLIPLVNIILNSHLSQNFQRRSRSSYKYAKPANL
jgi:hypothetical protein